MGGIAFGAVGPPGPDGGTDGPPAPSRGLAEETGGPGPPLGCCGPPGCCGKPGAPGAPPGGACCLAFCRMTLALLTIVMITSAKS